MTCLVSDKIVTKLIFKPQKWFFIKYFAEILNSKGDKGCKKVLKKYPGDAVGIPINSDEVIIDCDTRDDYFLVENKLLNNVQT